MTGPPSPPRPPIAQPASAAGDTLRVRLLAEGAQRGSDVAEALVEFIEAARESLDIAIYDCRLDDPTAGPVRRALENRRAAGVAVRLVYDPGENKPQNPEQLVARGGDPGESNTDERVKELGLPDALAKPASGFGALMHHKFMVRDQRSVWTGSLNWTDDSFARMENVVVELDSAALARAFTRDFVQLWDDGRIERSGKFDATPDTLQFGGEPAVAAVSFSPGRGERINEWVAKRIRAAERRIVICTMLVTSSKILTALDEQRERGSLALEGVFDRTQVDGAISQWQQEGERLSWKVDAIGRVLGDSRLTGKDSLPYRPGRSHNFMHNKTLVLDDLVLTGSYNLSHSAQDNAENMLAITSAPLAETMIGYTRELAGRFADGRGASSQGEPLDRMASD